VLSTVHYVSDHACPDNEPLRDLSGGYVVKLYDRRYLCSTRKHDTSARQSPASDKEHRQYTFQRDYKDDMSTVLSRPNPAPTRAMNRENKSGEYCNRRKV
jgi:hypothetical protein